LIKEHSYNKHRNGKILK